MTRSLHGEVVWHGSKLESCMLDKQRGAGPGSILGSDGTCCNMILAQICRLQKYIPGTLYGYLTMVRYAGYLTMVRYTGYDKVYPVPYNCKGYQVPYKPENGKDIRYLTMVRYTRCIKIY